MGGALRRFQVVIPDPNPRPGAAPGNSAGYGGTGPSVIGGGASLAITLSGAILAASLLIPGTGETIAAGEAAMGLASAEAAALEAPGAAMMPVASAIPIPDTLARVVPRGLPLNTLGPPSQNYTMVTAAEDIYGMNADEIAKRLAIDPSPIGYSVIEFPVPESGLSQPISYPDPRFVGGGYTAGGAREFTVLNGPIPPGSVIRTVP